MMRRKLLALAAMGILNVTVTHAQLLTNGSFEADPVGTTNPNVTGWNFGGGGVTATVIAGAIANDGGTKSIQLTQNFNVGGAYGGNDQYFPQGSFAGVVGQTYRFTGTIRVDSPNTGGYIRLEEYAPFFVDSRVYINGAGPNGSFSVFRNTDGVQTVVNDFVYRGGPVTVALQLDDYSGDGVTDSVTFDGFSITLAPLPVYSAPRSGDWNVASNWQGGTVPNGPGQKAILGSGITGSATVYTDAPITLGELELNSSPNSYLLTGTGSLTLSALSGNALVNVLSGSHKLSLPIGIPGSADISTASGSTLVISDRLALASGATLSKNGDGNLTIQAPIDAAGPANIKINGGTVNLDAANNSANVTVNVDPATLRIGANQTFSSLVLDQGGNNLVIGLNSRGVSVPANVTVTNLTVTPGAANIISTQISSNSLVVLNNVEIQTGGSLVVQGPGTVTVGRLAGNGSLNLASGNLTVAPSNAVASVLSSLTLGTGSFLNLTNNTLIVTGGTSADTLRGYVRQSLTGGTARLGSSLVNAQSAPFTTLAVFANTPDGVNPYFIQYKGIAGLSADAVIVKYTYVGDTNLDGVLDGTDYRNVTEGFATGQSGWYWGDVDSSGGVVDQNDLSAFLAAYDYFLANTPPSLGDGTSSDGISQVVPEPSSLVVVAPMLMSLRRRRR